MPKFNFDLFTKPDEHEETLLRDRKLVIKYWENDGKAEFIRDIIALANMARMIGDDYFSNLIKISLYSIYHPGGING